MSDRVPVPERALLSLRRPVTWILVVLAVVLSVVYAIVDRQHVREQVELNLEIADAAITLTHTRLALEGPIALRGDRMYAGEFQINESTEIVDDVHAGSRFGCTIFQGNVRIATTARAEGETERAIGTEANAEITERVYERGEVFRGVTDTLGKAWVIVYVPLDDHRGARIGMIATFRELKDFQGDLWLFRLLLGGTLGSLFVMLVALVILREQRARQFLIQARQLARVNEALERKTEALTVAEAVAEAARADAVRASSAKSSFLAHMSHELRTPLNAILGYSELLAEELGDLDDASLVKDAERIQRAGAHLLALINDILDLSKIEAGKLELEVEAFELGELLDDLLSTARPLVDKNDNRMVLERSRSGAWMMSSDPRRLKQILLNLLSNACKFTSGGVITLRVHEEDVAGRAGISFAVSDTGIGVAADRLPTLFDAFTQAERSTSRKFGGTGLGLAITRELSQLLGGGITAESELGVGTTFTVRLPLELDESGE